MRRGWRYALLVSALLVANARGGEIPGIPSQLPPTVDRDLELSMSNDFLGRGGSTDDFRTQQLVLTAKLNERWIALIDHSILTRNSQELMGRIDQFSGSLGYQLINDRTEEHINSLTIGAGFRSIGEFAGERMQNGFHRLVGSATVFLPYTNTERTDATGWLDAQHYKLLRGPTNQGRFGSWGAGYWLHGNTLVTSDGQMDTSAAAFLVAHRKAIDVWFGLRQDWRSGYEDDVLRETADEEEDLAVVIGFRFGALVIETVQQTSNAASYGQLRLVSSGHRSIPPSTEQPRMGIDFGAILPDVQVQLSGRFKSKLLGNGNSAWRRSLMVDLRYGRPQIEDDPSWYVQSYQLTAGLDWERLFPGQHGWMSFYANASAGWRSEELRQEGVSGGSPAADRGVLNLGAGFRFQSAMLGAHWRYRIQTGLSAWLPFDDAKRQIGGETIRLQEPGIGLHIGMTFDYD